MKIYDRKSPSFTKVVTGVNKMEGIAFKNGDIIEEIIVLADDIVAVAAPTNVSAVVNGEGSLAATVYVAVSAVTLGLEGALSAEVVVEMLDDTTSAVVSWDAVEGASSYRIYSGSVTETYVGYIESDGLSVERVDATIVPGVPVGATPTSKSVTIKTSIGGGVLQTLVLTANDTPLKLDAIFIAGADTSTLFFTPEFGTISVIVNYKPSQTLFDHASFIAEDIAHSLPTATGAVLGGVKIGAGINITDGVISVADGGVLTYSGFITQSGTDAPTIAILRNDLPLAVWARTAAGTYTLTKVGAFPEWQTVPMDDNYLDQSGNLYNLNRTSADVMTLTTYAAVNTALAADGVLNGRFINIEIYN